MIRRAKLKPAMRRCAAAAVGLAATSALCAATIESLDVHRKRGRYSLVAEAHLDATADAIFRVLTDYGDNGFARISRVYKESRYLEPAVDGTPMVYTRMEGCLLFYCMSLRRTERLETERPYRIKSYALPEQSNFKYSTSEWELVPDDDGGTNMTYELVMEPDFFVPPVIGPWYLKRTLADGGERAVTRIERLARELDSTPAPAATVSAGPPR